MGRKCDYCGKIHRKPCKEALEFIKHYMKCETHKTNLEYVRGFWRCPIEGCMTYAR
jgi:hypothetical protein